MVNRVFESSGPEGKIRGTPQQIIEKYQVLSRDAALGGDRVAAENFAQHSEHYARILNNAQREVELKREQKELMNAHRRGNHDKRNVKARGRHSDRSKSMHNPLSVGGPRGSGLVSTPENSAQTRGGSSSDRKSGHGGSSAQAGPK